MRLGLPIVCEGGQPLRGRGDAAPERMGEGVRAPLEWETPRMLRPGARYRDTQAKVIIRDQWRYRPTGWGGHWVRARPSVTNTTMPHLIRSAQPGSLNAITAPDGMYVELATAALTADILAIEICGSLANVHDKRSRFSASVGSLLLRMPRQWLIELQQVQRASRERWQTFGGALTARPTDDLRVPVARLRLFLLVPDDELGLIVDKIALEAHEYLLPHSALDNQYLKPLKELLTHAFATRVWPY